MAANLKCCQNIDTCAGNKNSPLLQTLVCRSELGFANVLFCMVRFLEVCRWQIKQHKILSNCNTLSTLISNIFDLIIHVRSFHGSSKERTKENPLRVGYSNYLQSYLRKTET